MAAKKGGRWNDCNRTSGLTRWSNLLEQENDMAEAIYVGEGIRRKLSKEIVVRNSG